MKHRAAIAIGTLVAAGAVVVAANSLIHVTADKELVLYKDGWPDSVAPRSDFSAWRLRRPFSDYKLISLKVFYAPLRPIPVETYDGRTCEIEGTALLYRNRDFVLAAQAHRLERDPIVEETPEFVGRMQAWAAQQMRTKNFGEVAEIVNSHDPNADIHRAAAAYGIEIVKLEGPHRLKCPAPKQRP